MSTAALLSLPREIRDQILDLCLTTALPPAPPSQKYTVRPLPSSVIITGSGRKKWQPLFNFPLDPRTNGGGLILTCRQISAETRDALGRLNAHGRLEYVVRLRIEEEEGDATGERERYWVDWVVLPTRNWLESPKRVTDGTQKGKERVQKPLNLVVEVEETMRSKPSPEHEDQENQNNPPNVSPSHQQRGVPHYNYHDNQDEPPQHLSALFRRYHFLCRPELRPPLPPPPVMRSVLRVAEQGVLLLHWTLGDLVARAVAEGPCCFGRGAPPPPPLASCTTSVGAPMPVLPPQTVASTARGPTMLEGRETASSSKGAEMLPIPPPLPPPHAPSSSSQSRSPSCPPLPIPNTPSSLPAPPPRLPRPRPFALTLRCARPASPASSSPIPSPTQPLAAPLLEFLPFYLHSAKLSDTPFRDLVARGMLRGLAVDVDGSVGREGRGGRPQGQARCPVPGSCGCVQKREKDGEGEEAHLHWACEAVRRASDEEERRRRSERQVFRDYDDDW